MLSKISKKLLTPFIAASTFVLVLANPVNAAEWTGYSDVTKNNVHYDAIKSLTEQDIFTGYETDTFKPWQHISREHIALVLNRMKDYDTPADVSKTLEVYADVNDDYEYAEVIAKVTEAGVFEGAHGDFKPQQEITRQQVASVLVRALDLQSDADVEINLSNVSKTHQDSVQILASLGLTTELSDYRPAEAISRGAMASLIDRALHAEEGAGDFDLSIMHVNDTHAHVENMPSLMTAINQVRDEKPDSLLLHGGDVFSGTLYFNVFKGQADLALMKLMNFDAVTLGNHEFDLGASDDGHEALVNYVSGANFPIVSTNVDFSEEPLFDQLVSDSLFSEAPENGQIYDQIVKEVNGEKIGIFGLTTEDTKDIASPEKIKFTDYKKAAEDSVTAFEEKGIDKIIAVTHIGYDSNPAVGNDLLLAEVEGIDVIVGGHSHTELSEPVIVNEDENGNEKTPTVIVQAGQYANNLGTLDVTFDADGVVTGHAGELLKLSTEDEAGNPLYPKDPDAVDELKSYKKDVDKLFNEQTTATAVKALPNPRQESSGVGESVRANETALGNLITDGLLYKAEGADIAFQNGGGIRTSIDQGPITNGEIIEVLPFGNLPVVVDMTGEQIKEVLEHGVSQSPGENGAFLHVAGMKFTYDSAKDVGDRVLEMKLKTGEDQYEAIDLTQTYTITTNAFTAEGGDGFDTFAKLYKAGKVRELGSPSDWEDLKDYLEYLGDVEPEIEGRIIDVSNES